MKIKLFQIRKDLILGLYRFFVLSSLKKARKNNKKVFLFLGTPLHHNIGDQAIAYAETEFIKNSLKDVAIIKVPLSLVNMNEDIFLNLIHKDDVIVGVGGGNMGDAYMPEEICRRNMIQRYPNNRIVLFPQTIHFSDSKVGQNELKKSMAIYSSHKRLTVIAREQISYKKMREVFSSNNVLMTPDIVLSLNYSNPKKPRDGLLICLRNDKEGSLMDRDKQMIDDFVLRHFKVVKRTDTIAPAKLSFFLRSKDKVVQNKLDEFKSSKFVLTDRLHGMVFAAITGTPCIAMANFNHKVSGTYRWISKLTYIKFCDDVSKLDELLNELDLDRTYSYDPSVFNEQWQMLRDEIL